MCYGQDIITLKDGTDIKAIVTEVGSNEIRYKDFENQSGPVYVLMKSEVFRIRYKDGKQDLFSEYSPQKDMMTYNPWSGKVSVNGETIPNDLTYLYFSPYAENLFKKGRRMRVAGIISTGIGAPLTILSTTYFIDQYGRLRGRDFIPAVVSIGLLGAGIGLWSSGDNKIKLAVKDFNSNASKVNSELSLGIQSHGFGLVLNF